VNYYIRESGIISRELLPIHTGWESPSLTKKAWVIIHSLKFSVEKAGIATGEAVQVITDRSYIPLDPNKTMTKEELDRLADLNDIASLRHADARQDASKYQNAESSVPGNIVSWSFILIGITVALYFIGQFFGG